MLKWNALVNQTTGQECEKKAVKDLKAGGPVGSELAEWLGKQYGGQFACHSSYKWGEERVIGRAERQQGGLEFRGEVEEAGNRDDAAEQRIGIH